MAEQKLPCSGVDERFGHPQVFRNPDAMAELELSVGEAQSDLLGRKRIAGRETWIMTTRNARISGMNAPLNNAILGRRGRVSNGVVVFDSPLPWPDGTEVEIHVVESEEDVPTLYDRLKGVVGIAQGLPPDFAEQHDHYIHGTPPQQP